MESESKEYRTDVLSLAVFLCLEGHAYQSLEMRGDKAVWVFLATDELNELVNDYQLETGSVPPRAFMEELTRVRRELFQFLDKAKHKSHAH